MDPDPQVDIMPVHLNSSAPWPNEFPIPDFESPDHDLIISSLMTDCREKPDSRSRLTSSCSQLKRHILDVIADQFCRIRIYPSCKPH